MSGFEHGNRSLAFAATWLPAVDDDSPATRKQHDLSYEQVKTIEIYLIPRQVVGVNRPEPKTVAEAQVSMQSVCST